MAEQNISARQWKHIVRRERGEIMWAQLETVKYFKLRQEDDGSFYFAMDLGDEGTFRSVFWADINSWSSYLQFHSVLVFDVTYKFNKFRMP